MISRVDQIIELERDADHLETQARELPEYRKLNASADFKRWRAAQLIAEELASGTSQRALASETRQSQTQIFRKNAVWQRFARESPRPPFGWAMDEVAKRGGHPSEREPEGEPEEPLEPIRQERSPGAGQSREREVLKAVRDHLLKDGELPSARSIGRELGDSDDRTVRAAWDKLHEQGKLPPRPGPKVRGGPAGQLLDDAIENLRGFIERAEAATGKEKESGSDYWLGRLGTISQLTDEALRAVNGESLEAFLQQFEKG